MKKYFAKQYIKKGRTCYFKRKGIKHTAIIRNRSWKRNNRTSLFEACELPLHEAIREDGALGYESNLFHTHYPLISRYLDSNIGRPWDDVYSEIRSVVRSKDRSSYLFLRDIDYYVLHDIDYYSAGRGVWFVDENGLLQRE